MIQFGPANASSLASGLSHLHLMSFQMSVCAVAFIIKNYSCLLCFALLPSLQASRMKLFQSCLWREREWQYLQSASEQNISFVVAGWFPGSGETVSAGTWFKSRLEVTNRWYVGNERRQDCCCRRKTRLDTVIIVWIWVGKEKEGTIGCT